MPLIHTLDIGEIVARPKRVVFTGDFMRPSPDASRPTQHHNIRWLRNLISSQVSMATDLPHEVLSWNSAGVRDGRVGDGDITRLYQLFGLARDIRAWAAIFHQDTLPSRVERLFQTLFADSLVIGFELPPYLEHFLSRNGIPFVGLTMHPVRFLDDIFFGVRSNILPSQEKIFGYRIDEAFVRAMAGIQKASAARYFPDISVQPHSALFLMQTWYDQSQIRNGEFTDAREHLETIVEMAKEHREFLVKEHPLAPNPATPMLQARIPNLRMVTGNVYGYMALPEIKTIGTISSSVGVEASYFGLDARFIMPPPVPLRRRDTDSSDAYVGVYDAFLQTDFWRDILSPILPVTAPDGCVIPQKPNRLRISMRAFWNFNEIDSDVTSALVK